MSGYRRYRDGRLFFFTLVTQCRRPIFRIALARRLLHEAIACERKVRPWTTEAIVLLPDHLHMLWRLPENDDDYSLRISGIKKRFTRSWLSAGGGESATSASQERQRCRGVWQKRFWEHRIRDAADFHMHLDYIHLNPAKHGLTKLPRQWPFSSFHRYARIGWYTVDWCGRSDLPENVEYLWAD